VRSANGSVVQFTYGYDGIDPVTSRYRKPRAVEPGEPVGIICAQAIGEKLTQLTLDTFHRAGVAYKHGLLRVKALLDAATPGALLRGARRAHTMARYRLDALIAGWQPLDSVPARVVLEMRMRGDRTPLTWRAEPRLHGTGLRVWHVAARVRQQLPCASDDRYIYAGAVPSGTELLGAPWAGSGLVDNCVQLVAEPPLGSWHASEPPIVARQLGIEAACASMQEELAQYMTGVDRRHLILLADAMTRMGEVQGATRAGIRRTDPSSVLGRACFETAPQVLSDAARLGATDPLQSASSRLAIGCLPKLGANAADVIASSTGVGTEYQAASLLELPPTKRARFGAYM